MHGGVSDTADVSPSWAAPLRCPRTPIPSAQGAVVCYDLKNCPELSRHTAGFLIQPTEESAWHCLSALDVKPLASNGSECRIGMSSSAGRAELNTPFSQPTPLVIHPLGELQSPTVATIQTASTAEARDGWSRWTVTE